VIIHPKRSDQLLVHAEGQMIRQTNKPRQIHNLFDARASTTTSEDTNLLYVEAWKSYVGLHQGLFSRLTDIGSEVLNDAKMNLKFA